MRGWGTNCLFTLIQIVALFLAVFGARADSDLALKSTWPVGNYVTAVTNTFVLTVTNAGPDSATGVTLTNSLPAVLTFVSATAAQGACSHENGTVVCSLGEVQAGQTSAVTIAYVPMGTGNFTNVAVVFSAGDTNLTNNVARKTGLARYPLLSAIGGAVMEGHSGTTNLPFTFWLEAAQPWPATFDFRTSQIDATPNVDFIASTGMVVFPAGVLTQVVEVLIIGDLLFEGSEFGVTNRHERVGLTISNPTNLVFGQIGRLTGRIDDDDVMPSLTIEDAQMVEGESGFSNIVFRLSLSEPSGTYTLVNWATSNGTAVAGSDYTAASGSVGISAGSTNGVISVPVHGDATMEADESFLVVLTQTKPTYATLTRTQAVATILSDELGVSAVTLTENAGTVANAGEVFVGGPRSADLIVTLSNSRPAVCTVPSEVIIAQGQTNVRFSVTAIDDTVLNGTRLASVTATAPLHQQASTVYTVHDNETTTLTLSVPSMIEEGAPTQTGTVHLASAPAADVDIDLMVDDPLNLQVPQRIRVSAGELAATFPITAVADTAIEGSQIVTVNARVENWTQAAAAVTVLDRTNMTLVLPPSLVEGLWATGIVHLAATLPTNFTISLHSSLTSAIEVPESLVVNAGETTAAFPFQAKDNAEYIGTQHVTITVSSPLFGSSSNTVAVFEDDPHHFTISRVPASHDAYTLYYGLVLTARDAEGNALRWFNRSASLTATGMLGSVAVYPDVTSQFVEGVGTHAYYFRSWDNNVRLTVSDGQGHFGESNPFNVRRVFHHEVVLAVRDLAWDAVRKRICASVWDYQNSVSNCIAFIDPETGKIESTLYVGQSPGDLAITEDSSSLYIGLLGTNVVRRLNLATRTVNLEFNLGVDFIGRQIFAEEIEVQPGSTNVVAISRAIPTSSPRHEGIAIYENATMRPVVYDAFYGPNPIEFGGSPTRLYGYDTQSSTFGFHRMNVTASGVQPVSSGSFFQGYGLNFRYSSGRIYVTSGAVYNPETGGLAGSLPNAVEPLPAPDIGKVLAIRQNGSYSDHFQVFDEATLSLEHWKYIPGAGRAITAVRCGPSTVAFNTSGSQLYILYSDYLGDLDQDGLADAWEREHFGNASSTNSATADADGDGLTNLSELIAGTNPTNAASRLVVLGTTRNGPDNLVTFATQLGRWYRLQRTSDLSSPSWTTVDEVPGTGAIVSVRDAGAGGVEKGFYRLEVFQ